MPNDFDSHRPKLTIYLADDQPLAGRISMLETTVKSSTDTSGQKYWAALGVEGLSSANMGEAEARLRAGNAVALVVLTAENLTMLTDGHLPRRVCAPVNVGYELLNQLNGIGDVYFLAAQITGVEILSLLLSGARGVLDMGVLGSVGILRHLCDATRDIEKGMNRIAAGHSFSELDKLIQTVRVKWRMAPEHWRLLLAFGEVPVMKLPCGFPPNQDNAARALARYEGITGYVVSKRTARKIPALLDYVGSELDQLNDEKQQRDNAGDENWPEDTMPESEETHSLDEDQSAPNPRRWREGRLTPEEKADLPYLPVTIRHLGFPQRLLPIRGLDQSHLSGRLYDGILGIDVLRTRSFGGIRFVQLTMARKLY